MPPEGQSITTKPVTLSVNHSAVVSLAEGTAHVQFVDLTVGFGRSTGVAATTVDNVLLKNCTVGFVTNGCCIVCTVTKSANLYASDLIHCSFDLPFLTGVRPRYKWRPAVWNQLWDHRLADIPHRMRGIVCEWR